MDSFMKKTPFSRLISGMTLSLALLLAWFGTSPARGLARAQAAQQDGAAPKKTAEQAYKNIQVLQAIPADELIPAMQYITVALGVRCDYCHVQNQFEKDDKPEKHTARKMMQMMFAINKDSFNGHRDVTCYTCHRGAAKPVATPIIAGITGTPAPVPNPAPATASPPAASLPTPDQVLDKYVAAIGGADTVQKITTRVAKGTLETSQGFHAAVEIYRKAPDKSLTIVHTPNGDFMQGYDGTTAWTQNPRGQVQEQTGAALENTKRNADFYRDLHLKQEFSRFLVAGIEKVGDREAYLVLARAAGRPPERLYFDTQTGLLLRWITATDSPLGVTPTAIELEDYRDADGTKVPFVERNVRPDNSNNFKFDDVQTNVPIDDARFAKPVPKNAETPAPKPSNQ
jgi:photosynthetic reaction center cytochrome c subunit